MKKHKSTSIIQLPKNQLKSPQINIATLSLCLLLGLAMFISFATNTADQSPIYYSLSSLKKYPNESLSHINLARLYIFTNNAALANTELQLASISSANYQNQVLGESSDITQLRSMLTEKPLHQQMIRSYWEKIVAEHPLYRDAWVQLLYIAYNAQDKQNFARYQEKLKSLDPNFKLDDLGI